MHFSYWNVDWPIESHACVGGRILTDDGMPARGASVSARGLTYTGTSPMTMTDADGRFCIDALRSENPGEDVDQDGVPGETQTISIRVVHNGRIYDGGETDTPREAGSCDGPCGDIGDLRLTPDRELHPILCSVTITVRDRDSAPVAGALVFAADDTVDSDVAFDLCLASPQGFCLSSGITDESGTATLTNVVIDSLFYAAFSITDEGDSTLQRWGEGTFGGCPSQPLMLTLTEGYRLLTLALQLTPPSTITWNPTTYPVTALNVISSINIKWSLTATGEGFSPPVLYGTVPAGASQVLPLNNAAPPPLSSGDFISLLIDVPGSDGYPIIGQGFAVVP
jgi:hypothetical protein